MKSSSSSPPPTASPAPRDGTSDVLADLCAHGDEFVAAAGGKGGRGNRTFASGGNRSPRRVEMGTAGGVAKCVGLGRGGDVRVVCDAVCMYELELRLIADVGLVSIAAQHAAACARCNAMR